MKAVGKQEKACEIIIAFLKLFFSRHIYIPTKIYLWWIKQPTWQKVQGHLCWDLLTWGFSILPERLCIGCLCWSLCIWSWLIDGRRLMLWRLLSRAGSQGVHIPTNSHWKTKGKQHQWVHTEGQYHCFFFSSYLLCSVMFICLYCYLGQTNWIYSQMSYFRASHCFPEM